MLTTALKLAYAAATGMMLLQARYRSMSTAVQQSECITELGWPFGLQDYYDTVLLLVDMVEDLQVVS